MKKQSDKNPKRAHVIFTITAGGACFPPVLLQWRNGINIRSASADDAKYIVKVYEQQFSADPHTHCNIWANLNNFWGCVSDASVFREYFETVFIPNYIAVREGVLDELAEEEELLAICSGFGGDGDEGDEHEEEEAGAHEEKMVEGENEEVLQGRSSDDSEADDYENNRWDVDEDDNESEDIDDEDECGDIIMNSSRSKQKKKGALTSSHTGGCYLFFTNAFFYSSQKPYYFFIFIGHPLKSLHNSFVGSDSTWSRLLLGTTSRSR